MGACILQKKLTHEVERNEELENQVKSIKIIAIFSKNFLLILDKYLRNVP